LGAECGADDPTPEKFIIMKFCSCFTILKFKGNFGYRNHEMFSKTGEVMNEEIYLTYYIQAMKQGSFLKA
jgi:hypothetical protein